MVSCISTCFYFSNILELKWQEEEEEEKDHTHIAEECNISDILLNLLLLCSVKLKRDEVFGIFLIFFGLEGFFSAALKLFVHFSKKAKIKEILPRKDTSSSHVRTDPA